MTVAPFLAGFAGLAGALVGIGLALVCRALIRRRLRAETDTWEPLDAPVNRVLARAARSRSSSSDEGNV